MLHMAGKRSPQFPSESPKTNIASSSGGEKGGMTVDEPCG